MTIYLNGKMCSRAEAAVSVFDHGLLYGDGVFEGIRFYNGRVFKCDEHLQRLHESAHSIMLRLPCPPAEIKALLLDTIRRNDLRDGYVRLIVTRGEGNLGLNPFTCATPGLIIIADRIALYPPALYQQGMAIVTVATQRTGAEAVPPRVKSLNYLNNILAKIEAINAGCEEAVLLNRFGFVAECTGDNIFIVKGGVLLTPPVSMGALQGITRDTVLALARQRGCPLHEATLTRHDLYCADECFLTGTAAEVIPVTKIDGRVIGSGAPGPVMHQLREDFLRLTQTTGTPIYA
jgi:branched-chain amino acid aminotransferase